MNAIRTPYAMLLFVQLHHRVHDICSSLAITLLLPQALALALEMHRFLLLSLLTVLLLNRLNLVPEEELPVW